MNSPDVTLDNNAYFNGLNDLTGVTDVEGLVQVVAYFKTDENAEEFEEGAIISDGSVLVQIFD